MPSKRENQNNTITWTHNLVDHANTNTLTIHQQNHIVYKNLNLSQKLQKTKST